MPTYELHVLIDPAQEPEMARSTPEGWRKTVTVTSTGVARRQPMWTRSVMFANKEEALNCINALNIPQRIVRVKVECLGEDLPDVQGLDEYLEVHMKLDPSVPYEKLALACLSFGVQLLINPESSRPWPVTTMRCYNMTGKAFRELHQQVVAAVKPLASIHKTHFEHGVFDSNPQTDAGWLFPEGAPIDTLITAVDTPYRLHHPLA